MSKLNKFIKIPQEKLKEMTAITDLLRTLQYQYNLVRKDMQVLQFQTLRDIDPEIATEVEKGIKVYDVDYQNGQYVIKPTQNNEGKAVEAAEAIKKQNAN